MRKRVNLGIVILLLAGIVILFREITLLDTKTKVLNQRFVTTMSWSPEENKIAVGDENGFIVIWDLSNGTNRQLYHIPHKQVWAVEWQPSGNNIASLDADNNLTVFDAESGNITFTSKIDRRANGNLRWNTTSELIANSGLDANVSLQIWNPKTSSLINTIPNFAEVTDWSPDGHVLASSDSAKLMIWEVTDPTINQSFVDGGHPIIWRPDMQEIAVTSDHQIHIWDVSSGRLTRVLYNEAKIQRAIWHPQGDLLAVSDVDNSIINIWYTKNWNLSSSLNPPSGMELYTSGKEIITWSPDGTKLAAIAGFPLEIPAIELGTKPAYRNIVVIWDTSSGSVVNTLEYPGRLTSLAWKTRGEMLAYGGDNGIYIWQEDVQ